MPAAAAAPAKSVRAAAAAAIPAGLLPAAPAGLAAPRPASARGSLRGAAAGAPMRRSGQQQQRMSRPRDPAIDCRITEYDRLRKACSGAKAGPGCSEDLRQKLVKTCPGVGKWGFDNLGGEFPAPGQFGFADKHEIMDMKRCLGPFWRAEFAPAFAKCGRTEYSRRRSLEAKAKPAAPAGGSKRAASVRKSVAASKKAGTGSSSSSKRAAAAAKA
jgi:hypothetical protein